MTRTPSRPSTHPQPAASLALSKAVGPVRVVSSARSIAASRARRRSDLMKGNTISLHHGCFAVTANERDAAVEGDLIFVAHPALDAVADLRLVEQLALASVQHRRALIAIEREGLTSLLTSYVIRLGQLVERLERAVHDRERERIAQMRRGESMVIQLQRPKA